MTPEKGTNKVSTVAGPACGRRASPGPAKDEVGPGGEAAGTSGRDRSGERPEERGGPQRVLRSLRLGTGDTCGGSRWEGVEAHPGGIRLRPQKGLPQ